MFVDSLDALQSNSSQVNKCLLSLTVLEVRCKNTRLPALYVSERLWFLINEYAYLTIHRKNIVIVG